MLHAGFDTFIAYLVEKEAVSKDRPPRGVLSFYQHQESALNAFANLVGNERNVRIAEREAKGLKHDAAELEEALVKEK